MSENYRQIAEDYFKKELLPDEVVHHIDGDKTNNNPENLVIMKRSQHSRLHGSLYNGLKNWRREVGNSNVLCSSCLFVKIYESGWLQDDFDMAMDMVDLSMNWGKIDRSKFKEDEKWKSLIETLYAKFKRWKKEHSHDCYEQRNLEIVKKKGGVPY